MTTALYDGLRELNNRLNTDVRDFTLPPFSGRSHVLVQISGTFRDKIEYLRELQRQKQLQMKEEERVATKLAAEQERLKAPIFAWVDDDDDLFLAPKHANVLEKQPVPVYNVPSSPTTAPETPPRQPSTASKLGSESVKRKRATVSCKGKKQPVSPAPHPKHEGSDVCCKRNAMGLGGVCWFRTS